MFHACLDFPNNRAWQLGGHGGHAGKREASRSHLKNPKCCVPKKCGNLDGSTTGFGFLRQWLLNKCSCHYPRVYPLSFPNFHFPNIGITYFLNIYIYTQIYTYNHTHTHTHYTHIYASILTFSGRVSRKFSLETSNLIGPKEKKLNVLRLKHGNNIADIWPCMTVEWLNEFFCLLARLQNG